MKALSHTFIGDLTNIWQLPPAKRQAAMPAALELAGEF